VTQSEISFDPSNRPILPGWGVDAPPFEPSADALRGAALEGAAARAPVEPARSSAPLTGATLVIRELERRGIDTVAGIPGGAILPLYDALQASRIRHVLARHEQGAAFIAQGMARATGKVAVCLATSGPGATNLITALADARADSVPLVAITAQVPKALIGTDAFQEVDTCALARPVTKACFFAHDAAELAELLPRVFELAESGRPGPVLLDIPKCVLNQKLPEEAPRSMTRALATPAAAPSRHRVARRLHADAPETWSLLADELSQSERPLLYIGGGIHAAGAYAELLALARRADIPVVSSLHGLGAYPADDPLFLGMLGMHGAPYTNHATEEADLVIAVGARFDDRATGTPESFCRRARIVHFDIDERELGKIKPIEFGVVTCARVALRRLLEHTAPAAHAAWRARIEALRSERPLVLFGQGCEFLQRLSAELDKSAIVTTDVGQHQMWVAQCMPFHEPRTLLTSGGLGTMGFGLPAAIGAALALPERKVVCVSGDGSLLMNLQELATLAELGLNVTTFVMNNAQLGLVRQQQQLFYGRRYSAAHFQRGSDFAALARGFGVRGESATAEELTSDALRQLLTEPGPLVVDVRIPGTENVLPMVPPGASNLDMILSPAAC
jgi:acetolactate synthase-1/2/3 large subunit